MTEMSTLERLDLNEDVEPVHVVHSCCRCCGAPACGIDMPEHGSCPGEQYHVQCSDCEARLETFYEEHAVEPNHFDVCPHDTQHGVLHAAMHRYGM